MKVLTEQQQLKKESELAWKHYQILDSREGKLRTKIFSYEQRWIKSETKLRMMRFERDELSSMASQMAAYSNMLLELSKK